MKRKTLIIVIAVVAVMAIFSASAYAYFTWDAMNSGAQVGSGGMTATLESNPATISIAGLMPSNGSINDVAYYKLTNTGDADARFAVYVDPDSFWGNSDLFNHLRMSVVLHPSTGPFSGTGAYGPADYPIITNGWAKDIWGADKALTNLGAGVEPLYKGMAAVYKVTLWLDGPTSGNDLQHQTCGFNLKWVGGQQEAAPAF